MKDRRHTPMCPMNACANIQGVYIFPQDMKITPKP